MSKVLSFIITDLLLIEKGKNAGVSEAVPSFMTMKYTFFYIQNPFGLFTHILLLLDPIYFLFSLSSVKNWGFQRPHTIFRPKISIKTPTASTYLLFLLGLLKLLAC